MNKTKIKTEELSFCGTDPGAVKYGNFINYYSFHSAKERTKYLNRQMFPIRISEEPIVCLDIGCNTGELTIELYNNLKTVYPINEIHILAIDIDPVLIKRANESYSKGNKISFVALDITSDNDQEYIRNFLSTNQKQTFDVTFCFSVTMWIHINNGDEGLLQFLRYMTSISRSIIIEPQPWNCYRHAQRRMRKSGSGFPLYEILKIRANVESLIENILTERDHEKVYESPNSSWARKIQCYKV